MTTESAVIDRLRQIVTDPAARGLIDDVALIGDLVLTHDSIAESVHFMPSDPPASVGWKLVAVNLSDLAGKGAVPVGALLSLTLGDPKEEWEEAFISGVQAACESYALPLIGGDTIALPPGAPRVLGLTAIGRAGERVPSRGEARSGDRLWIVGTLGDSAAGLSQLLADPRATGPLVDIYRRPVPLLAAGQMLAATANAMMDVSDGLLIDAARMAEASGLSATIALDALPLSRAFIAEQGQTRDARLFAATGGDDYALLAALPAAMDPLTLPLPSGTTITEVGFFSADGPTLTLTDSGTPVELPGRLGYDHRGLSAAPMADRA